MTAVCGLHGQTFRRGSYTSEVTPRGKVQQQIALAKARRPSSQPVRRRGAGGAQGFVF